MKMVTRITRWMLPIIGLIVLSGCHRFVIPANTPTSTIALVSPHGRYVIAQGEDQGWSLRQSVELGQHNCGWFTLYELGLDELNNRRIALKTCQDRFVTAPRRGTTRLDREVWQESTLGDCGQFTLERQGDELALRTCAGKYLTAGDDGQEWPVPWAIVVENPKVEAWEAFTILPQR